MPLRNIKTKILATIGPSTDTEDNLSQLIDSGVSAIRLNFSHGDKDYFHNLFNSINNVCVKKKLSLPIIQDLQGPKIRIGKLEESEIKILSGNLIEITTEDIIGNQNIISTSYKPLPKDAKPHDVILIDDGLIKLEVLGTKINSVICKILIGGTLKPKKGMNLPGMNLSAPSLTDKDKEDLEFALKYRIDFVALSFVRHQNDIIYLRKWLNEKGYNKPIIAKIEKPQALENIDDIIFHSDAIMLARGDLGVEVSLEEVPVIQKKVLQKCKQQGRPAIVATQMLESMIYQSSPTRAETSDVATAIYDGADAVMLSAETATGEYPVESVKIMDKIIKTVEHDMTADRQVSHILHSIEQNMEKDAMMFATKNVASTIKASAIVSFTICGGSTLRLARQRPLAPIIALPTEQKTCRMLTLVWGVHAVMHSKVFSFQQMQDTACDTAYQEGFSKNGDVIVISASAPFGTTESSNLLHVSSIQRAET